MPLILCHAKVINIKNLFKCIYMCAEPHTVSVYKKTGYATSVVPFSLPFLKKKKGARTHV
jgi:hypothetical protein